MGWFDSKPTAKEKAALERQVYENGKRDAKIQKGLAKGAKKKGFWDF